MILKNKEVYVFDNTGFNIIIQLLGMCIPVGGTVKFYAQIHLQVWQNSVCTGQGNLPLIT